MRLPSYGLTLTVYADSSLKLQLKRILVGKEFLMYRYVITESHNGREVYVNLIKSSAGRYIGRQPHLLNLIRGVLQPMDLTGPILSLEHDMGRIIGSSDIVETSEKDTIFYAQPYKKDVFSRYVKNRSMSPSKSLTTILEQDTEGHYELVDTWVGSYSPPFPGDEKATADSKNYWENHALIIDTQIVQSKSITKTCPY
jgi:hypothetical protein